MLRLKNNTFLKERRQSLRKSETDAEKKIWQVLRNKQMEGLKFFRQYSVGKYILDFYCPKYKLAIEADGGQHLGSAYDEKRTTELKKLGISVLRFWDNEILQNIEEVYEKNQINY